MSEQEKSSEGIDFNQVLYDLNGAPMQESYYSDPARAEYLVELHRLTGHLSRDEAEELLRLKQSRPVILGDRVCQTLQLTLRDEKLDGNQKLKRITLAQSIQGSSDPNAPFQSLVLSKGEKKMILDMAEKLWSSLMYFCIHKAIEGNTKAD